MIDHVVKREESFATWKRVWQYQDSKQVPPNILPVLNYLRAISAGFAIGIRWPGRTIGEKLAIGDVIRNIQPSDRGEELRPYQAELSDGVAVCRLQSTFFACRRWIRMCFQCA